MWYWEYQVKIYDGDKEEIRSGLVTGKTFTKAMKKIENYYTSELMEVQMLKMITDDLFEFQYVMEDTDFDYVIHRKM